MYRKAGVTGPPLFRCDAQMRQLQFAMTPSDHYAKNFLLQMFEAGVPTAVAYGELIKDASVRIQEGHRADALTRPVFFEYGRKAAAAIMQGKSPTPKGVFRSSAKVVGKNAPDLTKLPPPTPAKP